MTHPWSHLPNAALIDWVLEDVRTRSQVWGQVARSFPRVDRELGATLAVTLGQDDPARASLAWLILHAGDQLMRDLMKPVTIGTVASAWGRRGVMDALLALAAFDDAGALFDAPPETMAFLVKAETPAAVLLNVAYHVRRTLCATHPATLETPSVDSRTP